MWLEAKHYPEESKKIRDFLVPKKLLPNQVFLTEFKYFISCDYGFTCTDEFFDDVKNYLINESIESFKISVLEPDPENFFYEKYSKYPILEIPCNTSAEKYLELLNQDLGDGSAGSIASVATTLFYYSNEGDLAIYDNNDYEVCIAAFRSKSDHLRFLSSVGKVPWISMSQAIEDFYILERLSKKEKKLLIKNYQ